VEVEYIGLSTGSKISVTILFVTHFEICGSIFGIRPYRLQHKQVTSASVCVCVCVRAICRQKCIGKLEQQIGAVKWNVASQRIIYKGCVYVDIL
jgi:hypothetical protein